VGAAVRRTQRCAERRVVAEIEHDRAGERTWGRLRQCAGSEPSSCTEPDQDRRLIARQLQVGLDEVRQVVEVARGKHAAARGRVEHAPERLGVDPRHDRGLFRQLLDQRLRPLELGGPGEQQHHRSGGIRNDELQVWEATVLHGFAPRLARAGSEPEQEQPREQRGREPWDSNAGAHFRLERSCNTRRDKGRRQRRTDGEDVRPVS
jgi:hypothetical protein